MSRDIIRRYDNDQIHWAITISTLSKQLIESASSIQSNREREREKERERESFIVWRPPQKWHVAPSTGRLSSGLKMAFYLMYNK